MRTVHSTAVSVLPSRFFSLSVDWRGMVAFLRELAETREVVGVPDSECAGVAYASSRCGYMFLQSLVHLECANLSAHMH